MSKNMLQIEDYLCCDKGTHTVIFTLHSQKAEVSGGYTLHVGQRPESSVLSLHGKNLYKGYTSVTEQLESILKTLPDRPDVPKNIKEIVVAGRFWQKSKLYHS